MLRSERLWPRVALGLAALAALAGIGVVGREARGGGAATPPGTIYFTGWVPTSGKNGFNATMAMDGDGGGKRRVYGGLRQAPGYQGHGGLRWCLDGDYDLSGPLDPDGIPPIELFAVSEQGRWVQLTADPVVHWTVDTTAVAWGKDDSFVSYTAWEFTADGGVRGGLYVIPVDWTTGAPVAGPPRLVLEVEAAWYTGWSGGVNLYEHDWSPTGTAVAYWQDNPRDAVITVADFSGGAAVVRQLAAGTQPAWSPGGGRIAYTAGGEVWTINPDGANPVRLLPKTTVKNVTYSRGSPSWSPDGAYLAHTEVATSSSKTTRAVKRVPAGGGAAVSLTADLADAYGPRWRP